MRSATLVRMHNNGQLDRAAHEPHPANEEQQHDEPNVLQAFVPAREAAPTFDSKHTGSSRK